VVDRLLVDVDAQSRVSVSTWRDGEAPIPAGEPVELAWPLTRDELDELRWYLEDYLRAPFGVYGERGPTVAGQLPGWGQAVFSAVFGTGAAREAYGAFRARAARPGAGEIVVRSAVPGWLGLPWELLCEPEGSTPVALAGIGVSRRLPTQPTNRFDVAGERLRVLMVISRPHGERDVGYRMIARPLLERLDAVRGQVDLVVLRPPTLDMLARVLREAREAGNPFQVVHFDGHGALTGHRSLMGTPLTFTEPDSSGVLVFEKPGGGSDAVEAERIAQVLAEAQVPVVVLNACQSGAVGKELEAAVATRLLAGGASAVVAMAYSVYAVAAAEFMAAFYEQLFAGHTVAHAVRAGRARMAQRPGRPSPKGELPLADWLIPVHYWRREVRFPNLRTTRGGISLDHALDQLRQRDHSGGDGDTLAPAEEFVGRDGLFYTLEVAARTQRVIVLHGPGGTGKTELAKAFGRWWRDTGGVDRPDLVFWHSFQPGIASFGLDGVISTIGQRLFGPDFALHDRDTRRELIHQVLAEHRLLLIWDNFESVASLPDPAAATPPLDNDGQADLKVFLARVAASSRSAVLVTSRTSEPWLGEVRRVPVGGLTDREAIEYADQLLAPYPAAAPRRKQRVFGELLEWLDGHPLSMRLMLPHLDTTDPAALLATLHGTTPLPGDPDGERNTSLPASITYSITHLDPTTRRLLVALCLFHGVADADVLGLFSSHDHAPTRFQGIDTAGWVAALDQATHVGLLTALGGGMYGMHPALPAYLSNQWRVEDPGDYEQRRTTAQEALLDAYAAFGQWLRTQIQTGDASLAFALIDRQRRTLGHLLGYALGNALWDQARAIAEPLDDYWDRGGLTEEARSWVDRAQLALEGPDGTPPPIGQPAGALWLFLVGSQANRQYSAGQLDAAETTYLAIRRMLQAQPETPQQRSYLATIYHQLGMVAQDRGNWDEAEQWYQQCLAILEELGDRPGMASSYHQLGMVAQLRGNWDEAERWYQKSLAMKEELGNRPGTANSYHQLGMVAQLRGNWDEAERWYGQSLTIREELGNRPGMADSYHQLGVVAQLRGNWDEAERWYGQSLTILEELGNRPGMAMSYGRRGLLAEDRGQTEDALAWIVRCVALFDVFPHPATGPGPRVLARLTSQLGMAALEQCWVRVTGAALPDGVRRFVEASAANEGGT
jgi:tetratricopeptide (TPR) repeat protein